MRRPLRFLIAAIVLSVLVPQAHAEPAEAQAAPRCANAALHYWQAFAMLPNLSAEESLQTRDSMRDPVHGKLDDAARRVVRRCGNALERLRRAAEIDAVDWGVDLDRGFDTQLPQVFMADSLTDYALLSARIKIADGDTAGGIDDLLAAWRLARHVSVVPTFMALSKGLGTENQAFGVLATHLKDLDDVALRRLDAGLQRMPAGGTMAAVAGEARARLAAVIADLRTGDVEPFTALERHFGTNNAKSYVVHDGKALQADLEAMLACADKAAALLQIPDARIGDFRREIDPFLTESRAVLGRLKEREHGNTNVAVCLDVVDRFFEANNRVLVPMARAAVAYRLGGEDAFRKVVDPFGGQPFGLELTDDGFEVTSSLVKNMNNEVASQRFLGGRPAKAGSGGG